MLKSWLYQNLNKQLNKKYRYLLVPVLFFALNARGQVANYVTNGSFEQLYTCSGLPSLYKAKGWRNVDSTVYTNSQLRNYCYSNVPSDGSSYQLPRIGSGYAAASFLCQPPQCSGTGNRGYLRNRLKSTLQAGTTYCVKFWCNIRDNSTYGIDGVAAFFCNNQTVDTITNSFVALTFITPQVQNPTGNILTDTMNWVVITGTFTANGNETNMVIGNFKSDSNTNKALINSTNLPTVFCDMFIDDVSCIPLNLPAYAAAGSDIWAIPGNTLYLGRPQDVGIDEACTWYKLPNTTSVIATAAGFSLTAAASTETYMVKQDICGVIKYDTVVVHASGVGLNELKISKDDLKIYPNPTNGMLNVELQMFNENQIRDCKLQILNSLGQVIREEEIIFNNKTAAIKTENLPNGIYRIHLITGQGYSVNQPFVINR